jgi:hypothetical protein
MKKFAVVIAALALVAIPVASASAAPGKEVTKFTASYVDPIFGSATCTGRHEVNPKRFAGSRDIEHCKSTEASKKFLTLVGGEQGTGGFPGATSWNSDFNGAAATSLEYTVVASAHTFKLVTGYAS